jgi:hypothetical protein
MQEKMHGLASSAVEQAAQRLQGTFQIEPKLLHDAQLQSFAMRLFAINCSWGLPDWLLRPLWASLISGGPVTICANSSTARWHQPYYCQGNHLPN